MDNGTAPSFDEALESAQVIDTWLTDGAVDEPPIHELLHLIGWVFELAKELGR